MRNPFQRFRQTGLPPWKKPASSPVHGSPLEASKENAAPAFPVLPTNVFKDFVEAVLRRKHPVILDIGTLTGSNVEYFFNSGVKVHVEDFLGAYRSGKYWSLEEGQSRFDESAFLRENLNYPEDYFDGLIVWDILNFVDPKVARAVVQRISLMMKPGSLVVAFFHTHKSPGPVPAVKYRLIDDHNLEYRPLGFDLEFQKVYQTRDVTQLFKGHQGVKFYLLKHNVLEVLLKKEQALENL